MTRTFKTDQEYLFELAWQMEQAGNSGWYDGDGLIELYQRHHYIGNVYRINVVAIPKPLRDGILYYSTGHGWRVRKNPHWFTVFCERFPGTVKMWREGTV